MGYGSQVNGVIVRRVLKPLTFLPAVLMMVLIFSFSGKEGEASGDLSYMVTKNIVEAMDSIPFVSLSEEDKADWVERLHLPVRKMAHMFEYALLSVLLLFPFTVYGVRRKKKYALVFAICLLYAGLDEVHQLFVNGRGGRLTDVLFDAVGSTMGILAWHVAGRLRGLLK